MTPTYVVVAGESQKLFFIIEPTNLAVVDPDSALTSRPGEYKVNANYSCVIADQMLTYLEVTITNGHPDVAITQHVTLVGEPKQIRKALRSTTRH